MGGAMASAFSKRNLRKIIRSPAVSRACLELHVDGLGKLKADEAVIGEVDREAVQSLRG